MPTQRLTSPNAFLSGQNRERHFFVCATSDAGPLPRYLELIYYCYAFLVATPAPRRRLGIVTAAPSASRPGPPGNKKLMPARLMSAVVRHLDLVSALILIMFAVVL